MKQSNIKEIDMKFLSRFLVALVVTVMAHGSLAAGAEAGRASGPKSSPKPSSADLGLIIYEREDPSIFVGEYEYTLIVQNKGPSTGSGTLDVRLSGGHLKSTWGRPCTRISSSEVRCDMGSIASGSWDQVLIGVDPDLPPDSLSTTVNVSGSVTGNQPDPDLSNNQKSESTTMLPHRFPAPPCPMPVLCGEGLYD